jgi:ATP synthase protein I
VASIWRKAGVYLDLIYTFPFVILAGAGLGWLVDRWAGTAPYGVLAGFVVGLVAAFTYLMRMLGSLAKRREDDDP